MDERGYDKMMNVNVKSVYFTVKYCENLLRKSDNACIIIMTSLAGYKPNNLLGMYSPAKLAITSIIKCIA